MISAKAVNPKRKEMMITFDNISQRILAVRKSGSFVFSAMILSTFNQRYVPVQFESSLLSKLLLLLKKVNTV